MMHGCGIEAVHRFVVGVPLGEFFTLFSLLYDVVFDLVVHECFFLISDAK
jgi:hypothetical protein